MTPKEKTKKKHLFVWFKTCLPFPSGLASFSPKKVFLFKVPFYQSKSPFFPLQEISPSNIKVPHTKDRTSTRA